MSNECGSIKHEFDDSQDEEMGLALFHLVKALYRSSLAKGQTFRAAALHSDRGQVTGMWRYTQIYLCSQDEDFNAQPGRAIVISENKENGIVTLTYVVNDQDHVAYPAQWATYLDYHKLVVEIAVFLIKGRSYTEEKELESRSNVLELFG